MMDETKDAIFIILDILESLGKSSKNSSSIVSIDENKFKSVEKELFNLLNNEKLSSTSYVLNDLEEMPSNKKMYLIGTLAYSLFDEKKFPTNKDIIKLAENSLNYKYPSWNTRSRSAIIGQIINEIYKDSDVNLEKFYNVWKEYISEEEYHVGKDSLSNKKVQASGTRKNYVDAWLEFFNNYKKG